MKELQEIVRLLGQTETDAALATVVKVQGSAYRHPGARMAMTADGRTVGMISGGCLESDVRERARRVLASGQPELVTYDSTAAEDIVFGLGLGCNGIVQVWIERLDTSDPDGLLAFWTACLEQRQTGQMATLFRAAPAETQGSDTAQSGGMLLPGARLLRWPDGRITSSVESAELRAALANILTSNDGQRAKVRNIILEDGVTAEALVETIAPPIMLALFGGGDDAMPLARLASLLGWRVTVVDHRPAYALPERFPTAEAVVCAHAETLNEALTLPADALAMIMTHSYAQDKALVRALLPRGLRYIGILGPKARTEKLLHELADEGMTFCAEWVARLHGPAGLDLGADTAEEIALSIVAEMQATLTGRTGLSLKHKSGGIHEAIGRSFDMQTP